MDRDDYENQVELESHLYAKIHHEHVPRHDQRHNSHHNHPSHQQYQHRGYPHNNDNGTATHQRRYWNNEAPRDRRPPSYHHQNRISREKAFPPRFDNRREMSWRNNRERERPPRMISPPKLPDNGKQNVAPAKSPQNKKKVLNPFSSKAQRMDRVHEKKSRAKKSRKLDPKVIFVEDDDEPFKVPPRPPPPSAVATSEPVGVVEESETKQTDDGDDDVILIPAPPPVVVSIDDSDEEKESPEKESPEKELPERPSQPASPSTNSLQSDDFIDRADRQRVKQAWYFQDDEGSTKQQEKTSAKSPKNDAVEVSSSDSEDFVEHNDDNEAPGPSSSLRRGPAVDNIYSRMKKNAQAKRAERREKERKSLSFENCTEENFISVLTNIIREEESDSQEEDAANDKSEEEIDFTKPPPGVPEVKPVQMEDIQLNLLEQEDPADIEDSMAANNETRSKRAEAGWNEEMHKYYYDSWGGENFTMSQVLHPMPRDSTRWAIDIEDRHPPPQVKFNTRCRNCQEFTHRVQNCPVPRKHVVCHMCGEDGHREARCPNKICLTCGGAVHEFTRYCRRCAHEKEKRCTHCQAKGHMHSRCPDKWRRYHSTIEDNVELNKEYKINERRWCSVCAQEGHFAHNCHQSAQIFGTSLAKTNIISHVPLYPIQLGDEGDDGETINITESPKASYALMSYYPSFDFNWSPAVGRHKDAFYNRFRDYVGLGVHEHEAEIVEVDDDVEFVDDDPDDQTMKTFDETFASNIDESTEDRETRENFSFTEEIKKINEERAFHIELKVDSPPSRPYVPPVFVDEKKEYEKTAECFGTTAANLQLETVKNTVTFDVDEDSRQSAELPEKSVGKILLTQEHSKVLLGQGTAFIKEMSEKYELDIRMVWESVGNMLVVHGTQMNQNNFFDEMKRFVDSSSKDEIRRKQLNTIQLPKNREKLIKFIRERLDSLKTCTRSINSLKDLTKRHASLMRSKSYKAADKCRVQLNMHYLGRYGLRDGKFHILSMARQLEQLEQAKSHANHLEFHKELQEHVAQVFSPVDHDMYFELLNELVTCDRENRWVFEKAQVTSIPELIKMSRATPEVAGNLFFVDKGPGNEESNDDVPEGGNAEDDGPDSTTREEVAAVTEVTEPEEVKTEHVHKSPVKRSRSISEEKTPKRVKPEKSNAENQEQQQQPQPSKSHVEATEVSSTGINEDVVETTATEPSISEKGLEIIKEALTLFAALGNQNAMQKLLRVKQKADNNKLTQADYESLLQIHSIVRSKTTDSS